MPRKIFTGVVTYTPIRVAVPSLVGVGGGGKDPWGTRKWAGKGEKTGKRWFLRRFDGFLAVFAPFWGNHGDKSSSLGSLRIQSADFSIVLFRSEGVISTFSRISLFL